MKKIPKFLFALFISSTALVTAQSLPSNPVCNLPSTPTVFNPNSQQPDDNGTQNDPQKNVASYIDLLTAMSGHDWSSLQAVIKAEAGNLNAADPCNIDLTLLNQYNLLRDQCSISCYQSLLTSKCAVENYGVNYCNEIIPTLLEDQTAIHAEMVNLDMINPLSIDEYSLLASRLWRNIVEEQVGASYIDLSITPEYLALDSAVHNSNAQINIAKLQTKIADVNSLELNTAIGATTFTVDELAAFNDFKTKLSAKCDASVSNYIASMPSSPAPGDNPAQQLQEFLMQSEISGVVMNTFSTLEQSCLYEYIHMLLIKRECSWYSNEDETFTDLQGKLDQFLASIDMHNPVTLLQAQMDMIAYENAVRVDKAK